MKKKMGDGISLRSTTHPKAKGPTPKLRGWIEGWAVYFHAFRTEYWVYDPAMLTAKQRKLLGIRAWKKFKVTVKETDRG